MSSCDWADYKSGTRFVSRSTAERTTPPGARFSRMGRQAGGVNTWLDAQ